MARWSYNFTTFLPIATGDAASTLTSGSYMALQGGSSTQRVDIWEVFMGGQATSSAPSIMVVARDSTVGVTLSSTSGAKTAALDPATAALGAPVVGFTIATTPPQRSTTLGLLNLSFNAFGGIVRWAAPDEHGALRMLGNAASFGEVSLSAFTGGTPGIMGAHMIFEPL
jgi:hypothetical protein